MRPEARMHLAQLALDWAHVRDRMDGAVRAGNWLHFTELAAETLDIGARGTYANEETRSIERAVGELGREHEPPPKWQDRVLVEVDRIAARRATRARQRKTWATVAILLVVSTAIGWLIGRAL